MPAARAEIASFTVLSFGYALRRSACGNGRFCIPIIRVWCALFLQRRIFALFLPRKLPMRAGGLACLSFFAARVDAVPIAQRVVSPPWLPDIVQAEMYAVAANMFFHRFALLLKIAAHPADNILTIYWLFVPIFYLYLYDNR